jgi:hypothetical protein
MSVCIFLGPTMPAADARRILDARYLPPASQGDVFRLVATTDVSVIGIIDGNFREVPSVWHKELLWAIDQGVKVIGAASMGALRAAELVDFGMAGEGRIFEAYRTGRLEPYDDAFEDDDEVAVIHAPPELGYRPLSEALIDIRCTLDLASRFGVVSPDLRDELVTLGKSLHYTDRNYDSIIEAAAKDRGATTELERLREWLPVGRVNQKQQDAVAMLARIAAGDLAQGTPISFTFNHTTMWNRLTMETLSSPSDAALTSEDQLVFNEVRLRADQCLELKEETERALRIGECPPARRVILAILQRLRTEGRYDALLSRAKRKNVLLAKSQVPRAADLSGLQVLQLLDWYFDRRLGCDIPDDVEAFAHSLGYRGRSDFIDALVQEYAFDSASGSDVSRAPRGVDHQPERTEG